MSNRIVDLERFIGQEFHDQTYNLPLEERKEQAEAILASIRRYLDCSMKHNHETRWINEAVWQKDTTGEVN